MRGNFSGQLFSRVTQHLVFSGNPKYSTVKVNSQLSAVNGVCQRLPPSVHLQTDTVTLPGRWRSAMLPQLRVRGGLVSAGAHDGPLSGQ